MIKLQHKIILYFAVNLLNLKTNLLLALQFVPIKLIIVIMNSTRLDSVIKRT